MAPEPSKVIVTAGASGQADQTQVHHRDFPEIRAEGESPAAAATSLVNHLTRALDSALTAWRRDTIQGAIADVQAFLQQAS